MVAKAARQVELDIIAAMIRPALCCTGILLLMSCAGQAQKAKVPLPDNLVIARDEFRDMGPPNDYYDVIQVTSVRDGLALDQVLITPRGQACLQRATVEERTVTVHMTMTELLDGRNPCAIPEKQLHREFTRCIHCPTFSGVNVTMRTSCSGGDRDISMDILDRDIYDRRTQTPPNTAWTMDLLTELNGLLGPDSSQRPIFHLGQAQRKPFQDTPLVHAVEDGKFDALFGVNARVSTIAHEAELPLPPPPSVSVVSVQPIAPIVPELPKYPLIGIASRIEGSVALSFEIDSAGKVQNLSVVNGPTILQQAAKEAVSRWKFPELAWGKSGRVTLRFQLNC